VRLGRSDGSGAFRGAENLRSISLPSTLENISNRTFQNASSLTNIIIPANVLAIDRDAFDGAKSLSRVEFEAGSNLAYIGRGAFNASAIRDIVIPRSVTTLGSDFLLGHPLMGHSMFGNELESIMFEEGSLLTHIANRVFINAVNLTSINLPDGLISIGESAFSGQLPIDYIRIPETVKYLGRYAFNGWMSHQTIFVPGHSGFPEEGWHYMWAGRSNVTVVWGVLE